MRSSPSAKCRVRPRPRARRRDDDRRRPTGAPFGPLEQTRRVEPPLLKSLAQADDALRDTEESAEELRGRMPDNDKLPQNDTDRYFGRERGVPRELARPASPRRQPPRKSRFEALGQRARTNRCASLGALEYLAVRRGAERLESEPRPTGDMRAHDEEGHASAVPEREGHTPGAFLHDEAARRDRNRIRTRPAVLVPVQVRRLRAGYGTGAVRPAPADEKGETDDEEEDSKPSPFRNRRSLALPSGNETAKRLAGAATGDVGWPAPPSALAS
jgi:hypothetical protein